ncbi:hypothetical protein RhiJN_10780 [Ceratobasidium sp. AG-Ba]|nr:hypothetical protein RhiJN_10780 [Ceratobasidium sp. AG-Ba]
MTSSPPRKVSGRKRFPTKWISEYDHSQGNLSTLAKSVRRPKPPPTAESQAAARAKEQAAGDGGKGMYSWWRTGAGGWGG